MDKSVVPIGKYKGQPLEVLMQDPQYVEWLTSQAWFRDKFPGHYTVIINNFQEAAETPEHNALQALYLQRKYREALARMLVGVRDEPYSEARIAFEKLGLDLVFFAAFANIPDQQECSYQYLHRCPGFQVGVEFKPVLGDDYPAVLRTIRRIQDIKLKTEYGWEPKSAWNRGDRFCVIVSRFSASVSIQDVRGIFQSANVWLFLQEEVEQVVTRLGLQ